MDENVTNDQIDTQFESSTDSGPLFAEDVFDKAIEHYTQKPSPTGTKKLESEGVNNEDQETYEEAGETDTEEQDGTEVDENVEQSEPEFRPYAFQGSVFGKEVSKSFDSPEELNRMISRGMASETLYKRLKERDSIIEQLKSDASSGKEFEEMAKSNPEALLDLVIENYMDEAKAAEKVLGLFEHYRTLSKMSPQERDNQRKLKTAEKLIRQQEEAEKAQQLAMERQQQLQVEQQKADDKNWANQELRKQSARFQNLDPEVVKQQILNVMARVRLSRQEGKPMSMQQASKLLSTYMRPFEQLASPAQARKKLGEAVAQKKQAATSTIQAAARQKAGNSRNADSRDSGPVDSGDIFDMLKQKVLDGQVKLR